MSSFQIRNITVDESVDKVKKLGKFLTGVLEQVQQVILIVLL